MTMKPKPVVLFENDYEKLKQFQIDYTKEKGRGGTVSIKQMVHIAIAKLVYKDLV